MWSSRAGGCASTNHRPRLPLHPAHTYNPGAHPQVCGRQRHKASPRPDPPPQQSDPPLLGCSHGGLHGALHCRQPHPALPSPRRLIAGQAGEGPGPWPGARPAEQHHVPGGEHLRRPRPGHGEAEADEPPPPRRHLAPHRRHGRPLRRLLRPRRVRRRRRRDVRQGQAGQRHQAGGLAQHARPQRPHAGAGAQGRPDLPGGGAGQDAGNLRHQRRLHPPGVRRSMEQRREQVHLPMPRIPVQQPGKGRPWPGATVAGLGARRRGRRQGALRPVGGDRLQDRRGPVVEGVRGLRHWQQRRSPASCDESIVALRSCVRCQRAYKFACFLPPNYICTHTV